MQAVWVYVGDWCDVVCNSVVDIGGLRYNTECSSYVREVLFYERLTETRRDTYFAVELTGRPTIRVVSQL